MEDDSSIESMKKKKKCSGQLACLFLHVYLSMKEGSSICFVFVDMRSMGMLQIMFSMYLKSSRR
jgi:hypothetical protein